MKVLVVGSGGREHAICEALVRSPSVERVHCAPGSDGIASLAEVTPGLEANHAEGVVAYARAHDIGLVVVGPEAPLVAGLADAVRAAGIPCFGPGADGAQLEGSKSFAKQLMARNNVPTASHRAFVSAADARAYVLSLDAFPVVVKADGLAAGKGVTVCRTRDQALEAVAESMEQRKFGDAGARVIVEEHLRGEEVSVMAVTDGTTLLVLPSAQDHKCLLDGDLGPNTGGMGAYSPAPVLTEKVLDAAVRTVLVPTLHGLRTEGIDFRGVLYAGLMVTRGGPKVLEFNVRFGDPETQVVLPRVRGDVGRILLLAATGRLAEFEGLEIDPRPVVGVVMASQGYPEAYKTGRRIEGIEAAGAIPDVTVFHAATRRRDGAWWTGGGRVLTVCAAGATHAAARDRAYEGVRAISWEGEHHRTDIAHRAIGAADGAGASR